MGKEIEVVFVKEEKGRFKLGETKKVAYGFARNFLFPQGYVVANNAENKTKIESITKKAQKRDKEIEKEAQAAHDVVHEKEIKCVVKTYDDGKLYGSISINEIVEKTNADHNTSLDKFDFKGYQPIKQAGKHKVAVNIHPNVETFIFVTVEPEEKKEDPKAKRRKSKQEADEDAKQEDQETSEVADEAVAEEA